MKYRLDDDIDISGYTVGKTLFLGDMLRITLVSEINIPRRKVLQLNGVVCFYDNHESGAALESLRIQSPAGAFGLDISLRLRRREIATYKEVYLITEGSEFRCRLKALAEEAVFRDANNTNDFFLY